jgi:pilus assembly protein Flp/PilA
MHFEEKCKALISDETGQNLIEYALVAALIAVAAITQLTSLGTAIKNAFTGVSSSLNSAI